MRWHLVFIIACAAIVLSCEDGTRRIFPNDNSATGDIDTTTTDDDNFLFTDEDELIPEGVTDVGPDGIVAEMDIMDDVDMVDTTVDEDMVSDDGTVINDDGTVITDDGTVEPDDGTIVADDVVVIPDNDNAACSFGDSRQIACGLNGDGLQSQTCLGGEWQDQGNCVDDDVCVNGTPQDIACGINGRGIQSQDCTDGQWVNDGACNDPDECVDNDTQTIACGDNDAGKQDQICTLGQWVNDGGCVILPQTGRWDCVAQTCTPVYGDAACGNGTCSPSTGESPVSCPADCLSMITVNGQNQPCSDDLDCAFYMWQASGTGYWECKWSSGQDYCNAVVTSSYCGTNGYDYCYYGSVGIETPATCAADCSDQMLNQNTQNGCNNDRDCIFLQWPPNNG